MPESDAGGDPDTPEPSRSGTQSVERAISVLRVFEKVSDLTPTEIAARTDLTVGTAYRIVRALHRAELLEQDPVTERYHLGVTAASLGRLAMDRMGFSQVLSILEQFTARTGESVNLGVRRGQEVVILLQVPSPHPLRFEQRPGTRNPAHVCAMGKLLLAHGPRSSIDFRRLTRFTPNTITTREALEAELDIIVEQGYAVNDEERLPGVRAVAAAIRGRDRRIVAAIAGQGPTARLTDEQLPLITAELLKTADEINDSELADRFASPVI
jgi:IclR family acetate operon transcriptional repressor